MSFSEKMRESLGAEGVRLEIALPDASLSAGASVRTEVTMIGGTKSARVEALVLRIIEADRHWLSEEGERVAEVDALALDDRRHLTAGWDRETLGEHRMDVDREVQPGAREQIEVTFDIPEQCRASTLSCAHTLNIQADIKGQIDPTQNARIVLGT